jgi:hypothetical protein
LVSGKILISSFEEIFDGDPEKDQTVGFSNEFGLGLKLFLHTHLFK